MDYDAEDVEPSDDSYDRTTNIDDLDGPYDYADEVTPVGQPSVEPDVLLDIPQLRVDEIMLDVEDLRAHVSLQAEVLDLLKLNVGADVQLGKVDLEIKGVEAQALLKVRLDRVAAIIGRVLTTIDRNPQILEQLTSSVGAAARDLGRGAGSSVSELGRGAGSAVGDIGQRAGMAIGDVGDRLGGVVDQGVGGAVEGVGELARDVSENIGKTLERTGQYEEEGPRVPGAARRERKYADGSQSCGAVSARSPARLRPQARRTTVVKVRVDPQDSPDIEIRSTVRAAWLLIHNAPDPQVRFSGTPGRESLSKSSRTNLTDPVAEEVSYEDVRVDYRLANTLKNADWPPHPLRETRGHQRSSHDESPRE